MSFLLQFVPIPTAGYKCNKNGGCCTRVYCPLTLAYARTIHKFQGLSAGPVDKGKIPNMYDCIVCDPDKNQAEGRALGLLYTAVSRATTLGDDDGLNSAFYFTGQAFGEERLRGLGLKKDSRDEFINVVRRRAWVAYLKQHTVEGCFNKQQECSLLTWIENSKVSYDSLYKRTKDYVFSFHQSRKRMAENKSSKNKKRQKK